MGHQDISSDIVEGANTSRAPRGWSAQACGLGQRSRNVRAAQSDAGFPRPLSRWRSRHAHSSWPGAEIGDGSGVGALAAAGSIELGLDMGGGNMDVAGGGFDVGVAQQGPHHRQIHAGLGQSGAEGVAQGVGMRGRDAGDLAVLAEDPPQPRRGERLPAGGAPGHRVAVALREPRFFPLPHNVRQ